MLFQSLYQFFNRNKVVLILLVVMAFSAFSFFASKVKLEEDINKFIPKDKKLNEINGALNSIKIKDKLVLNIYSANPQITTTEDLKQCAQNIADTLLLLDNHQYIKDITCKVSDDLMASVYETFYNNLPLFLDEKDYQKITSLLLPDSLKEVIKSDYKTLISPSSIVLGKFITKDPLSITPLALKKIQDLQFDENFELNDGYVFTKDNKNLLVFINSDVAPNEHETTKVFFQLLDKTIADIQKKYNNTIVIEYYGSAPVSLGNATQIKADSILTSIIAIVLIAILLISFFRRIMVIIYIMLPVAFGALFSLAVIYFVKGELSSIALGAGSIILGIAINYSMHFFTHYKHEQNVSKVIADLTLPMLLGCATTVGAFLSLQFAKSLALHDFGLFAGLSLIGAVLFSIIFYRIC